MIKIGLLGFGTVGTGVYEIINEKKGNYFQEYDKEAIISKILVRDVNKPRIVNVDKNILTSDPYDIIENDEIDIVIEVMGGMEPAYQYMKDALKNGKHVVTASKEVVSEHMEELFELAYKSKVHLMYEASVGGGIPIIASLKQSVKINKISKIMGILNGTTNFILSAMQEEGMEFEEALKLAQDLGFAEADPTADIEGFDVTRKLAILSSLAYQGKVTNDFVYRRGIKNISKTDLDMVEQFDYSLKHVARSYIEGNMVTALVEPTLLSRNSMMSKVMKEFNIISLDGNISGDLQFYGKGAGKDATANAVVGDVIYILNTDYIEKTKIHRDLVCNTLDNIKGKYYLRVDTKNDNEFSEIYDLLDDLSDNKKVIFDDKKLFFITDEVSSKDFIDVVSKIEKINENMFYARILD